MYSLHQQYLDMASGFHVIELRDERGNRHLIQLAVGHDCLPRMRRGSSQRQPGAPWIRRPPSPA